MSCTKKQDSNIFKIDIEIKRYIQQKLPVDDATMNVICSYYENSIRNAIRGNYLAHYVRSLEMELRKHTGNPFFNIIIKPLPKDSKNFTVGVCQYHNKRFATISYHPEMDDIQLRDCLAHELGHIFLCTLLAKEVDPNKKNTEPLASVLGILSMMDDNDFYKERCRSYGKRDDKKIVDDFIFINNKKNELKIKK